MSTSAVWCNLTDQGDTATHNGAAPMLAYDRPQQRRTLLACRVRPLRSHPQTASAAAQSNPKPKMAPRCDDRANWSADRVWKSVRTHQLLLDGRCHHNHILRLAPSHSYCATSSRRAILGPEWEVENEVEVLASRRLRRGIVHRFK